MRDNKLEQRVKNFQSASHLNLKQHRENVALSLRKERLFDQIMQKRISSTSALVDNNIEDNKSDNDSRDVKLEIKIPEHSLDYYNSLVKIVFNIQNDLDKCFVLKEWIKIPDFDQELSYKKYALEKLKNHFVFSKEHLIKRNLLDEDLIRQLINDLLSLKDTEAKKDISFIFTRITYISDTLTRLFYDKDVLQEMLDITNLNYFGLSENIIIILGNLLIDNQEFILHNTNFIDKIKEMLKDENLFLYKQGRSNYNLPIILLWCFNIIFNDCGEKEILKYVELIPYFMNFFNPDYLYENSLTDKNQEELYQTLKLFNSLSTHECIIKSLVTNDLLAQLIYLLQYINIPYSKQLAYNPKLLITLFSQNLLLVLKILNNLYSTNDQNTIAYMNDKFISVLEVFENLLARYRFFQKDDIEIVIEIVWTLSNIALAPTENVELLVQTKIPQFLLTYYLKNEKVLEQVLIFFENSLQSGSNKTIISILKLNFLQTLCNSFKSINKVETIITCLNCIRNIIKFTSYIINSLDTTPNVVNIIKLEFEKHGLTTRLEQLCLHNNQQISGYACNLLELVEKIIKEIGIN